MSHVQNLQHAVMAAKAGNPSLARVHLHKAAEEAPNDPAVWLWMGWLAESPVSMIQCLEMAMQDDRHRNVAQAGLAFARALSAYQVESSDASSTAAPDVPETQIVSAQAGPQQSGPVEVIEQLEAQVASIQEAAASSNSDWENARAQATPAAAQVVDWDPNGQTPPPLPPEAVRRSSPAINQSGEAVTRQVDPPPLPTDAQQETPPHSFNAPSPQPAAAPQPAAGTGAPVWRAASSDWFTVDGPGNSSGSQSCPSPVPPAFTQTRRSQGSDNVEASRHHSEPVASNEPQTVAAETETIVGPTAAEQLDAELERRNVDVVPESPAVPVQPTSQTVQTGEPPSLTVNANAPAARTQLEPWKPSGFTEREVQPYEALGVTASPAGPAATDGGDQASVSGPSFEGEPLKPATHPRTVLVVDDSPTVRKLVAMTLEKNGYRVVSAFDGVAAIKEIAEHNPAMILMDVNMPRMDGYQLCKLVRKHEATRHIPVLMLSGQDGMFDRIRGRMVGCSGYVPKPFVPEELVNAVGEHLGVAVG
ncbi:MAG: response regulator [Planctomycetota bacterium]|jgi:twitching motility two-component system response regulator PilG